MSQPGAVPEYSAGGVVFKRGEHGYEIVAVNRPRHSDWSLPKGHIEQGETREQAATREVKEETGIDATILEPLGEIVYFFRKSRGTLIRKSVFYFLMQASNFEFSVPNSEVAEARWIPLDEAEKLFSYENDLQIVDKARALLAQQTR